MSSLRLNLYALAATATVLLVFSFFVTYGRWNFRVAGFGEFYDAQAAAFLHGRLDVPAAAIGSEGFVRNGKSYGYFGPAPALPRLLLNRLFPGTYGRWNRLSLLLACGVNMLACWLFLRFARVSLYPALACDARTKKAYALFLLVCGLGSTNIFLATTAYIYHEAIAWGAALALLSYYYLLRYGSAGRRADLALAAVFCWVSLFSRLSVGSGTVTALVLALVVLVVARLRGSGPPAGHLALLGGFLATVAACYLAINYLKFGSPFEAMPLRLYVLATPERLERVRGTLFHPENVVFSFKQYFLYPNIQVRPSFPWFYLQDPRRVAALGVKLDNIEPFAGLAAGMPALVALSLLGIFRVWRAGDETLRFLRIVLLASFLGGAVLLAYASVSERYLHDFYPFWVMASAVGLHEVIGVGGWVRRGLLYAAAAASIFLNLAFAFGTQSAFLGELRGLGHRVDRALDLRPLGPIHADASHLPERAVAGNLLILGHWESLYWFDGEEWIHVGGKRLGEYRFRMRAPRKLTHREPLLVTGRPGACDMVYVEPYQEGAIILGFEHGPEKGRHSAPLRLDPGMDHVLEVRLDRLNRRVTLRLNGNETLRQQSDLYSWEEEDVVAGVDRLSCGGAAKFSGTIERAP